MNPESVNPRDPREDPDLQRERAEEAEIERDAAMYTAADIAAERDVEAVRADLNAVSAERARRDADVHLREHAAAKAQLRSERESARAVSWTLAMIVFLVVAVAAIGGVWMYDRYRERNDQAYRAQDEARALKIQREAQQQNQNRPDNNTVIVTPPPPVVVEQPAPTPAPPLSVQGGGAQAPAPAPSDGAAPTPDAGADTGGATGDNGGSTGGGNSGGTGF